MSGFRTKSVLHILLEHHRLKNGRQNGRGRFEQTPKTFGCDLEQNGAFPCKRRGAADTALQHGLLTKRVAFFQSRKNGTRVFIGHPNGARLNEVQLVSGFTRFEKNLALFELDFVECTAHGNNGGGEVSCMVRMTVDLRIPFRPGGMFFTSLEIT